MTTSKPAAPLVRDADAELEALFAAINDVILVLDAEGRYVKIAPTNPSLLYRPAAELLGHRYQLLLEKATQALAQIYLPDIDGAVAVSFTATDRVEEFVASLPRTETGKLQRFKLRTRP